MSRRAAMRTRAHLWRRVLKGHRFPSHIALAGVWVSAVIDVARQAVPRLASPAPLGLVGMKLEGEGAKFRARPLSDDLYVLLPGREKDVHDAILDPLRPGDVFVDVGANVGYYSVLASARVGSHGGVIAIEGWPDTANALRHNLGLNEADNVTVVECAVVGDPRMRQVGFEARRRASGLSRAVHSSDAPTVPAATLDSICRELDHVRVMKIDIEGGESAALAGATATLAKTDLVVVECEDIPDVRRVLTGVGFDVSQLAFTTHLMGRRQTGPSS